MPQDATKAELKRRGYAIITEKRWPPMATYWRPLRATDEYGNEIFVDDDRQEYVKLVPPGRSTSVLMKRTESGEYQEVLPKSKLEPLYNYQEVRLSADDYHMRLYLDRGFLLAKPGETKTGHPNIVVRDQVAAKEAIREALGAEPAERLEPLPPEISRPEPEPKPAGPPQARIPCENCSAVFNNWQGWKVHMGRSHKKNKRRKKA